MRSILVHFFTFVIFTDPLDPLHWRPRLRTCDLEPVCLNSSFSSKSWRNSNISVRLKIWVSTYIPSFILTSQANSRNCLHSQRAKCNGNTVKPWLQMSIRVKNRLFRMNRTNIRKIYWCLTDFCPINVLFCILQWKR